MLQAGEVIAFAASADLGRARAFYEQALGFKVERTLERLSLVQIEPSPSVLLAGMEGSLLPVAVAHGEGRAQFANEADLEQCEQRGLVAFRYMNHDGARAHRQRRQETAGLRLTQLCHHPLDRPTQRQLIGLLPDVNDRREHPQQDTGVIVLDVNRQTARGYR